MPVCPRPGMYVIKASVYDDPPTSFAQIKISNHRRCIIQYYSTTSAHQAATLLHSQLAQLTAPVTTALTEKNNAMARRTPHSRQHRLLGAVGSLFMLVINTSATTSPGTIVVVTAAQGGLMNETGPLNPHAYRPNEFVVGLSPFTPHSCSIDSGELLFVAARLFWGPLVVVAGHWVPRHCMLANSSLLCIDRKTPWMTRTMLATRCMLT
jgi:hypothetical protein